MNRYSTIHLPVSQGHQLAVYYAGNPAGLPVIYLHGGPGAACDVKHFEHDVASPACGRGSSKR